MNFKLKINLYKGIVGALIECISTLDASADEPTFIAALVTNLPKKLEAILRNLYPKNNFRVGGCFIHQKPLAEFCDRKLSKKNPEIGDLLIVYKRIQGKMETYNSLLLQAKKIKVGAGSIYNYKISKEDKHQLLLYTQWPQFIYRRAGLKLNGRKRSIIPKTVTPGAQYLLINQDCILPFYCAMPSDILVAHNNFAVQLINFIEFQTGRPFVKNVPRDSWSQMIWDLLDISFHSVFNKSKFGYHNVPRGTDSIADFLNLTLNYDINYNSEGTGIPVLVLQSIENEDGNNIK